MSNASNPSNPSSPSNSPKTQADAQIPDWLSQVAQVTTNSLAAETADDVITDRAQIGAGLRALAGKISQELHLEDAEGSSAAD